MRTKHSKILCVLLFLFASMASSQLFAVQYSVPFGCRPPLWQGFYVSGQVGTMWFKDHSKFKNGNFFNTIGENLLGRKFTFKDKGIIGGGALGYNYQCDCWVLGLEGGVYGWEFKDKRCSPFFPSSDRFISKSHLLATVKGRFGYAYDCFLPFFTVGWAGAERELRLKDPIGDVSAKSKKWFNGWTVGAGFDYKFWECISLGVAYDYIKLRPDDKKFSCSGCNSGIGFGRPKVDSCLQVHNLLFRLNYYFNLF